MSNEQGTMDNVTDRLKKLLDELEEIPLLLATQEEAGQHVGRTRGWVSQQLSQLEKAGSIDRSKEKGVIVLEGRNGHA